MDIIPPADIKRGTLLVASPEIESGFFFRGVLLVCEHNHAGTLALLVNKPLDVEMPDEFSQMGEITNPRMSIRAGGPMQTNQLMLLHSNDAPNLPTIKICDGVYLGGDIEFLQEHLIDPEGPHIHLYFGYSGWPQGGLEREFLNGSWFIHPAHKRYLFEVPPEKLWRTLLKDMGGRYATLSTIPDDLSVN